MELSYWESRWNKNNIGFHMPGGYPALQKYWNRLQLPETPHILVPLCGKTEDMIFLEQQGARVTGVEISEKAIRDFFSEHQRETETTRYGPFTIYTSGSISIWQGDFMKFPVEFAESRPFHLIYDKAALVALPPEKRVIYGKKLLTLLGPDTSVLLHHFIYPQHEMNGPPFSVNSGEIEQIFPQNLTIQTLEEAVIPPDRFPPFQRRGLKSTLTERLLFISGD